jgi:hypothetical protein
MITTLMALLAIATPMAWVTWWSLLTNLVLTVGLS